MKTASVTQSKNGLSGLLRSVRAGKSVLILDRDVAVARLEPVSPSSLPDDARLSALQRQGLIRHNVAANPAARLRKLPTPKLTGKAAVTALLADRAEDSR